MSMTVSRQARRVTERFAAIVTRVHFPLLAVPAGLVTPPVAAEGRGRQEALAAGGALVRPLRVGLHVPAEARRVGELLVAVGAGERPSSAVRGPGRRFHFRGAGDRGLPVLLVSQLVSREAGGMIKPLPAFHAQERFRRNLLLVYDKFRRRDGRRNCSAATVARAAATTAAARATAATAVTTGATTTSIATTRAHGILLLEPVGLLVPPQTRLVAEVLAADGADEQGVAGVNAHMPGEGLHRLEAHSAEGAVVLLVVDVLALHVPEEASGIRKLLLALEAGVPPVFHVALDVRQHALLSPETLPAFRADVRLEPGVDSAALQ